MNVSGVQPCALPIYEGAQTVQAFLDRAGSRLRLDGRVQSWSAVSLFPLSGGPQGAPFLMKGDPITLDPARRTNYRFVEPDYFRTMQIPVRAGRDFSAVDTATSQGVAIVSEQFVRQYLAGREAVGTHLIVKDDAKVGHEVAVVGIVANCDSHRPCRVAAAGDRRGGGVAAGCASRANQSRCVAEAGVRRCACNRATPSVS